MSSARWILGQREINDLVYTLSPRRYIEAVEKRPLFAWQEAVLDDTGQFVIIDGARQSGKSTVVVKPAAHSARFFPGSLTVILAATESQAVEDMIKTKAFISLDPFFPEIKRSSDSLLELSNGSRIIVVPATEKSARGFSQYDQGPRLIIVDEGSRVEELVYTSGVLPMLTDNPDASLFVISTPNGRKGFFFDSMQDTMFSRYLIRAPWEVVDVDWQLVPAKAEKEFQKEWAAQGVKAFYSPRHRDRNQQEFFLRRQGPLMYRQEMLAEFVEPEDQVFTYEDIQNMFANNLQGIDFNRLETLPEAAMTFGGER